MKVFSRVEIITIAAGLLIFTVYNSWSESSKRLAPVEQWFNVLKVSIPDFEEGTDPIMVYDHEPKLPATITRVVEIVPAENPDSVPICTGRDVHKYENDFTVPEIAIRLSAFVGRTCNIPPGVYVAKELFLVRPEGYPTKRIRRISDPFHVLPHGAQPFITENQQEQLEKAQELLENPIPLLKQLVPAE